MFWTKKAKRRKCIGEIERSARDRGIIIGHWYHIPFEFEMKWCDQKHTDYWNNIAEQFFKFKKNRTYHLSFCIQSFYEYSPEEIFEDQKWYAIGYRTNPDFPSIESEFKQAAIPIREELLEQTKPEWEPRYKQALEEYDKEYSNFQDEFTKNLDEEYETCPVCFGIYSQGELNWQVPCGRCGGTGKVLKGPWVPHPEPNFSRLEPKPVLYANLSRTAAILREKIQRGESDLPDWEIESDSKGEIKITDTRAPRINVVFVRFDAEQ